MRHGHAPMRAETVRANVQCVRWNTGEDLHMKASVLTAFGPPEVLQVGEVGTPVTGEHEVLIRVRATTVTFADRLVRNFAAVSPRAFHMPWLFWLVSKLSFGFRTPRVRILGSEFSGTVEGVGALVTQFEPGDAVYGFRGARMGAYAEYLCMNERGMLALKPATLTFEEAASLPYGALMAMALLRTLGLQRGQRLLVVGASGGIGRWVVQLAAQHVGATVTGVCGSDGMEFVRALGATTVIDYTRERFVDRPESYDVIVDILGTSSFARCRRILAPRGRLVYVSFKVKQLLQMLWTSVVGDRKVRCVVLVERREDLDTVRALVEAGTLRPIVDRRFPLAEAAAAHRYAEGGANRGAVVISVA